MWVIYSLLSAFFVATTDPIAKKILRHSDEYIVGWSGIALSTPFLAILYFSYNTVPFNSDLFKTLIFVMPFEVIATILYYKALRSTDISLSVPFLALTPVFVILTGFLLLGERVKPAGVAGILLITIGVYSLNWKEARYGLSHPIKAILLNKGSMYMVLVALIYSLTSVLSKRAMLFSSPQAIPFIYNISLTICMAPFVLYRLKKGRSTINKDYRIAASFVILGLLFGLSSMFYFKSVALTGVAYAISIKRLSLLLSVGYGWLFFRERDIYIRLFSTFCMFLGVVLVLISQ